MAQKRSSWIQRRNRRDALMFFAFITPNFLLLTVFTFWPVLYSFYLSFFRWNMIVERFKTVNMKITSRGERKQALIRKRIDILFTHSVLLFASLVIGMPFVWMITTAIKSPTEVHVFPPIWWPEVIRWDNFVKAWLTAPFGRFYINSIITTVWGVVFEVIIAALSAYAFARIRFKYRDTLF